MSKRAVRTPTSKLQSRHPAKITLDFISPSKLNYEPCKDSFDLINYLKVEMLGVGEPGQLDPPQNENIMKV